MYKPSTVFVGALVWAALSSVAHAHIKLLQPDSWLNEDELGGPQKGGPCGPGGFDDEQPVPLSTKVTTVVAGDTLTVEFEETIHHPGWFRISLAEDPADFEEIAFPNANNCNYDLAQVPSEPHGNVLLDGLGKDTDLTGPSRTFSEQVKLPDRPCEKCTLQVIQVMADALHAPPDCIYYHCATLKILPSAGAAADSGDAGSESSSQGSAPSASAESGCSVARVGAGSSLAWVAALCALAVRLRRRRKLRS